MAFRRPVESLVRDVCAGAVRPRACWLGHGVVSRLLLPLGVVVAPLVAAFSVWYVVIVEF